MVDKKEEVPMYRTDIVATEQEQVILNEADEKVTVQELLVKVANDVEKLTKHLVG